MRTINRSLIARAYHLTVLIAVALMQPAFLHAVEPPPDASRQRLPSLADAERAHIVRVLEAVNWNKKQAATVLEISRGTLYRKIVEYGLEGDQRPAKTATRGGTN